MISDQNYNLKHQYHPVKYAFDQFLYLSLMKYMSMINIKYNFIYSTALFLDSEFKSHYITTNIFRNLFLPYQVKF